MGLTFLYGVTNIGTNNVRKIVERWDEHLWRLQQTIFECVTNIGTNIVTNIFERWD